MEKQLEIVICTDFVDYESMGRQHPLGTSLHLSIEDNKNFVVAAPRAVPPEIVIQPVRTYIACASKELYAQINNPGNGFFGLHINGLWLPFEMAYKAIRNGDLVEDLPKSKLFSVYFR